MINNPFEVTKAVDFTDQEIAATWVDLPGDGLGSTSVAKSPMPTFLVGGKGGGRTHLLRYLSFPLQKMRHVDSLVAGLRSEGYVGIYFRCGGLNSSRFSGKGQPDELWAAVFSHYTELWLGKLTIDLIRVVIDQLDVPQSTASVRSFVDEVQRQIGVSSIDLTDDAPLERLSELLTMQQRSLDGAVNAAALSRTFTFRLDINPGQLTFGVPQAAARHLSAFDGLAFSYLLDEFENLTLGQQRYINTLVREKELPATFVIGSRLFGVRTHETLSAGEENRQGSEFDMINLEGTYRSSRKAYGEFCQKIVRRRLEESGLMQGSRSLGDFFEVAPAANVLSLEDRAKHVTRSKLSDGTERPWHRRLRTRLHAAGHNETLSSEVIDVLRDSPNPLHEKLSVFMFYRSWAARIELREAAVSARAAADSLKAATADSKLTTTFSHYKGDLYAQLLHELRRSQEYHGLQSFVSMSGYLPRNLLVLLKQVTRWALYLGEHPFRGEAISLRAQHEGVQEASSWFLNDSKGLGPIGHSVELSIRRLGSLFRDMRFSDRPVEVSCSAFSTDRRGLSPAAVVCLDSAVSHSLLVEVPLGRLHRNSGVLHRKYQLNPMLAPLFDLSLARRGSVYLSGDDLNIVFDHSIEETHFESLKNVRLASLNAPFADVPSQATLDLGLADGL